jgi:hypothetical protein
VAVSSPEPISTILPLLDGIAILFQITGPDKPVAAQWRSRWFGELKIEDLRLNIYGLKSLKYLSCWINLYYFNA